jgi:hypothetical protein
MEDKLKIKISIADRVYQQTIRTSPRRRLSASKKIDSQLIWFEQIMQVETNKMYVQYTCALYNLPHKQNNFSLHQTLDYDESC